MIYKFSAKWCQPCRLLSKQLEQANIYLTEYDIDLPENKPLLEKFGVRTIPTIVVESGDQFKVITKPTVAIIKSLM